MRRKWSVLVLAMLATCSVSVQAPASGETDWQWQLKIVGSDRQTKLVWQRADGPALILEAPSFTVPADERTGKPTLVTSKLVSHQLQGNEARFEYALTLDDHGAARTGACVIQYRAASEGARAVLTRTSILRFANPLRSDLTIIDAARLTGKPATWSALPLRDGVVSMSPAAKEAKRAGYFQLGRGSTPREGQELALPVIGLWIPDGTFSLATDPYDGAQFQVQALEKGTQGGSVVTISYIYAGSLVPVNEEKRTEVFVFHKAETRIFYQEGVEWMLSSFYDAIPEIHPSPAWIQGIQLDYYDYISSYKSEPGQGWYHDVQKLADKIPAGDRGKVVLCLHGYYDYVPRFCYDEKTGRLIESWISYDKDARPIPMSLAEVHRRIKFAKDRGFHVVLLYGDGTATDNTTPYFRKDWVIKNEQGLYPSRGFWEWRPDIKVKIPPGYVLGENGVRAVSENEYPTNFIMDPAMPAVHDWFMGYTRALLNEYGRDLDGFVWDEAFLTERNWVSFSGPHPTYSDRAMMHLVSDISQLVQGWHKVNPDLVFLVADNAQTPYGLAAHGTWQDSAMSPQMWAPGFLLNYRTCLWSCLWYPITAESHNQFAVEHYRLPQGVSNGWGDNEGPATMPEEILDRIIQRFLARIQRGGDRIRYLVTTDPFITDP